jgi:hypothetical protein
MMNHRRGEGQWCLVEVEGKRMKEGRGKWDRGPSQEKEAKRQSKSKGVGLSAVTNMRRVGGVEGREGTTAGRVSTVRTERAEVIIVDRRGEKGQDDGDGGK